MNDLTQISENYSTVAVCEKCNKPKYYIGSSVDKEFLDNYLCHCEMWEKIRNDLLIKYDDLWKRLADI